VGDRIHHGHLCIHEEKVCGDEEVSRIVRGSRGRLCSGEESGEEGVHAWSRVRKVRHNRHIPGAHLIGEEDLRLVVEEAS